MITLSARVSAACAKVSYASRICSNVKRWDQQFGIEPAGAQRLQQHRRALGVDQPRGDRNNPVPQMLQMKVHLHAMHADVGNRAARRDDLLAQFEGGGYAHRFDGSIDATPGCELHDWL